MRFLIFQMAKPFYKPKTLISITSFFICLGTNSSISFFETLSGRTKKILRYKAWAALQVAIKWVYMQTHFMATKYI
ncbi:hypothetical protein FHW89_004983 [Mucilaginibacter sp. SG564]|nr:hypothetical protein [Mucilaginibacter sp. SG564]